MTFIFLFIACLYALFTSVLWIIWLRIPAGLYVGLPDPPLPRLSVIIPVRNEAGQIAELLADLDRQTYRHFEVIVADDASTDSTAAIVQAFVPDASFPLTLLPLQEIGAASPKKRAITQSIRLATGDLIVTTDGDCRVGPGWLGSFAAFYRQTGAKLISGPVSFLPPAGSFTGRLFTALQTVEFASLIGSGATTLHAGAPTMCNGANLCYEKAVFYEVNGFAGVDHLASGDDEFLMHKIAGRYPTGVRFLKSPDAIVLTAAHQSLTAFYNQRRRWASKWQAYQSRWPSVLAVFVFLCNLAPLMALACWLTGSITGSGFVLILLLKVFPEFLFLRQILLFLQKKSLVPAIFLTALVYPFYVVFFGLAAQGKGYQWKGRKLN
ncbi:glycosyltransferase [Arsenicibacter rosenii]|uniref:Glycosyl transferase family 2 n=1 Tax=Arsenicibacter rosenii TaxID=1750698 RepID=A0A1S2VD24_9BACT|nr:glycosyltransferase [Arsenicibacter rosenii]OIN56603.1 glycosyl transferase family 2 [Arsenicibacter rosenii]